MKRIELGYRKLPQFNSVSTHSPAWKARLTDEFGVEATVVGNGVELALYAGACPAPEGLPSVPFAVYVGSLEGRVDLDLLETLARTERGLPVVVAGPANARLADRLQAGPLQWIGPIAPSLVPGLLKAASVALLPHIDSEFTRSMDPMKVLEYLAAGLAVVSTQVPLPEGSEHFVRVADTREEFVRHATELAASARRSPPLDFLAKRDWQLVAQRLLEVHWDV